MDIYAKRCFSFSISWGSGANPWGPDTKEDQFYTPNHWDGMLEVVGVTGVMHLGQIQSGLRTAMRIAQVKLKLINNSDKILCFSFLTRFFY